MSDPYAEAIDALTEVATLCADEGMAYAAPVIAVRAHGVARDGLTATAVRLAASANNAGDDEERAAYQMAHDALQRIIARAHERGLGADT